MRSLFRILLALLLLLPLSACAYLPGAVPDRPPLLIEGLELPPGTVQESRSLKLIKEYPKGGGAAEASEVMYVRLTPPGNWDELVAHMDGQLSTQGFTRAPDKEVEKPEWITKGTYKGKTVEFNKAREHLKVELLYTRMQIDSPGIPGSPREAYTLRVTSGAKADKTDE